MIKKLLIGFLVLGSLVGFTQVYAADPVSLVDGCSSTAGFSSKTGSSCATPVTPAPILIGLCGLKSNPSMMVTSPNGGEVYQAGQQITVTWKSCNIVAKTISIGISNVNGMMQYKELISATPNDGTETITLPSDSWLNYGKNFKIVLGNDASGGDSSDDYFTINSIVTPTPVATVDLKINGSDNPAPVVYKSQITATWTSTGVTNCSASGSWVAGWNGTDAWGLSAPIATSGSKDLMAALALNGDPTQLQQSTPLLVKVQCMDAAGASIFDSVTIPVVSAANPINTDITPRIAYWYGKVNQHLDTASGQWMTDPDGVSGANLDQLTYCQKWYPTTTLVANYRLETITGWRERGNVGGPYPLAVTTIQCITPTQTAPILDTTPRIAFWWGKVNQHVDASGVWQTDQDGESGADLDPLAYCQKWYPSTTSVQSYKSESITGWKREQQYEQSSYTATETSQQCVSGTSSTPINTSSITVISPNGGETIKLGQNAPITWNTTGFSSNDTVSISLKDDSISCAPGVVGCWTSFGVDSVKNTGLYNWDTTKKLFGDGGPNSVTLSAGKTYRISLSIQSASNSTVSASDVSNNEFTLSASTSIPATPYYIRSMAGQQSAYTPNQKINISVKGIETLSGNSTSNDKGFNIQSYIYKDLGNDDQSLAGNNYLTPNPADSYNGVYTQNNSANTSGTWTVAMNAPSLPGNYLLSIGLYCSKSGSYCDQKYGSSDNGSHKIVRFTVSQYGILPAGCISSQGFSTTTGQMCGNTGTVTAPIIVNPIPGTPATPVVADNTTDCSAPVFTKVLRLGYTGSQVEALQGVLNDNGYLVDADVDGHFGLKTKAALMAFQKDQGGSVLVTGYTGSTVRGVLNALASKQCAAQ